MKTFRHWRYLAKFFLEWENVLDRSCKEHEYTYCMFGNFFSENRTVYENVENVMETEGPQMTSQYGAYALHAGLARHYASMHMHTPTRSGTNTHASACTHTQTSI
jgi:hypothetical protein